MTRQLEFAPVVLDRAATQAATDEAVDRNAARMDDEWKATAWAALDAVCTAVGPGGKFIIDAVWERLGEIPTSRAAASRIGPVMREYAATGRIRSTGSTRPSRRPVTHKKPQREWMVVGVPPCF